MTLRRKRSRIKLGPKAYRILCDQVHTRDGWKCQVPYCGKRTNLHAHHIIFRSHGGDDVTWNLITVCHDCHDALHFRCKVRDQGLVIMPLVVDGVEQPVDADKGVRKGFVWKFINGWLPRKTLR